MVKFRCKRVCKEGGGPPFCKIRKRRQKKEIDGCWQCELFTTCEKLDFLKPGHGDTHIKNLRILKSIQAYLKDGEDAPVAVYPIKVPDDLLYQIVKLQGADTADKLINHIFRLGLTYWSDNLYTNVFGSEKDLEDFIELVKERNKQ